MRDLEKDLALCEAATKGPWVDGDGDYPDINSPNRHVITAVVIPHATIEGVYNSADIVITENDRTFIKEAREGWPEAIRRAMAAEAEVEGLRDVLNVAADALRPFAYEDCGCKARLETGICHHVAAQVALLGLLSVGKAGDPA